MARVIVILALMLAITAALFAITRKTEDAPAKVAAPEPSTTVQLAETPDPAIDLETESLKSVGARDVSAAATPTATTQDVAKGPVAGAAPTIGTAGIDRKGRASFTGTATPGDKIVLLTGGKSIGSTKADKSGSWSLGYRPRKIAGEMEILVQSQSRDGTTVIGPQRAIIGPPETKGGLLQVKLTSAGPTAPAPEVKTGLVVEKAAPGKDGQTLLHGRADPGATVKVAINDTQAGETRVAADGTWSLTAENASGKEASSLHFSLIDKNGAKLDEASVPYKIAAAPKLAAVEVKAKPVAPPAPPAKPEPPKSSEVAKAPEVPPAAKPESVKPATPAPVVVATLDEKKLASLPVTAKTETPKPAPAPVIAKADDVKVAVAEPKIAKTDEVLPAVATPEIAKPVEAVPNVAETAKPQDAPSVVTTSEIARPEEATPAVAPPAAETTEVSKAETPTLEPVKTPEAVKTPEPVKIDVEATPAPPSTVATAEPAEPKDPAPKPQDVAVFTSTPSTSPSTSTPGTTTVIKVRRGDSLWRIARRHLGDGKEWQAFYEANKEKIDNPDLIFPGQELHIPG